VKVEAFWPSYKLFEYERRLAEEELRTLGAADIEYFPDGLRFQHRRPKMLLNRLTYFNRLKFSDADWSCIQREVERRHLEGKRGQGRQATRFGVHGFHEYKGKFNPQLARAMINVVDPAAKVLADPFSGSGTALVEAIRLGLSAHGRDRSPMAVFLSAAKLNALTATDPQLVAAELGALSESVSSNLKRGQDRGVVVPVAAWSPETADYLASWFTKPAYSALCHAMSLHPLADSSVAAHLSLVALSSVLRQVSLQAPEDLRVRRRPAGYVAPSLREAYVEAVDRLVAGLNELHRIDDPPAFSSRIGNADDRDLFGSERGRRLIVTSPPYATALPYIDTDRLSLLMLGILTPKQVRSVEASLTGSREWGAVESRRWRLAADTDSHNLPAVLTDLLRRIDSANQGSKAGFRRAAVPPLLYRYFVAMRDDFKAWHGQLRDGERAVVVVGRNRTGPAGSQTVIDTPALLAACAEQVGFLTASFISLETWPRYGLHAANGVDSELAVVLERGGE